MLIDVPYRKGDCISLKLTSGEEVIGRLEEEKNDSIVVSKPMMIAATQEGLGLAPFMFSVGSSAKFVLKMANILCVVKSDDEFSKQYLENTTGIHV
jgi:hypothetical protein